MSFYLNNWYVIISLYFITNISHCFMKCFLVIY